MKNILFVQVYGGGNILGGTEVYLKNLLQVLKKEKRNTRCLVATFNKTNNIYSQDADAVSDSGFTRFLESYTILNLQNRIPVFGLLTFVWGIFWLYKTGSDSIRKNNINIIYGNGGLVSAIVTFLLSKTFHIRYILHFHGLFEFKKQIHKPVLGYFVKNSLIYSDKLIANSDDVAKDLQTVVPKFKKPVVISCFTNQQYFHPIPQNTARRKLHLNLKDFIVVAPGRLEKDKRTNFLLRSFESLRSKDMKVIFIGNGELAKLIKKTSQKNANIRYLKPQDNEKLPLYLNSADLVWGSCSVSYLGLNLIEALACGRPIMASNIPVSNDITDGVLVEKNTIPDTIGYLINEERNNLAELLTRLYSNKKELEKKSKNCRKYYEAKYAGQNIAKIRSIIYNSSI